MALLSEPQIGTTQLGMTPIDSITLTILTPIPWPRMRYYPERKRVKLTSRKSVGVGGAYIVWHWDFLKPEWRHALRDYIATVSVDDIFIESRINDDLDNNDADDWAQFEVIATWQEGDENIEATRRMGFDLEFDVVQKLVPLSGGPSVSDSITLSTGTVTVALGITTPQPVASETVTITEAVTISGVSNPSESESITVTDTPTVGAPA